ncbi:MAG: alkaline phosphatase family protein [Actinomycetota bacterium]
MAAVLATPVTAEPGARGGPREACRLPQEELERTARGYFPGRGGQLQTLTAPPDFVGPGLPHVGPWDYLQHVPMLWYGPGQIAASGRVGRSVTSADIAATQAALLQFDRFRSDGQPMHEVLPQGRREPPKLIITMIWDAAGMNVLDKWGSSWPYLRSLIPKGTWYEHATVGTSPSTTAPVHATIGTGMFPQSHGVTGHRVLIGNGVFAPWETGSTLLIEPTLADIYDRAMDNEPIVGEVATREIHLGLIGHGSDWGGGDKDIVVLRAASESDTLGEEGESWNLIGPAARQFRFPKYANRVDGLQADVAKLDQADGAANDRWRDNPIEPLLGGFETPARVPYQNRLVERLIRREHFGKDAVPDLLFLNYKLIDFVSHAWSMNSLEMRDSVRAQDEGLRQFVAFLNKQVGRGKWVLALTADHGAVPQPSTTGATVMSPDKLTRAIDAHFGAGTDSLVLHVQGVSVVLDEVRMRQLHTSPEEIAAFVASLSKTDLFTGAPPSPLDANRDAFEAAFASSVLEGAPCLQQKGPRE